MGTMTGTSTRLTAAVEAYFADLGRVRASGGGTGERSSYGPLTNLFGAVGAALKPKVFCVGELADQGAGHPDFGLYTAKQVQRGRPREGQTPERGVVEVKAADDDAWLTAAGDQVSRYWSRYRLVLVTNTRDFVLVGEDAAGRAAKLETFRLADGVDDFHRKLEKPRAFAREVGAGLGEYLCRALSHRAALAEPRDLAWLLASYARDGLARVEAAGNAPSLEAVRKALEDALGVRFEGERGARFFRSALVQTLFYGVFSAWVLWARAGSPDVPPGNAGVRGRNARPAGGLARPPRVDAGETPAFPGSSARFDWRTAVWHLRAPVLRALFQQLATPGQLQPLGLVEVLDWTAAALDRVDQPAFFARFHEGEAVPYFYEPFLEAFDPALRKQLGVWYTPAEVVRYMVARVDRALKDDLGIADGLAAENVYVLDPCCGTGAYLAEVLRRIAANLEGRGLGALAGARVKQAATGRVFGFEIMPAPFVVAHLQVGLTMQDLDAPLADDGEERAGVFLTNALTGWEPRATKPLPFPELEEERDRAERVKQDKPILVILGNPPYNGFAGMAVDEERALSEAYRTTRRVRRPEGQGLNDLYVRFFRMAERRIAEKTGQGVVCFISNYSWLDGLSFTGMRERYLEAFDTIRIDNLHGDRIISEYAPDGRTSETVFALPGQSPGIKVGTGIALLSRSGTGATTGGRILYRDFHQARAAERRQAMLESLDAPDADSGYSALEPSLHLGLPFKPMAVSDGWFDWPALPDLFPVSFPGVQTKRDSFLIDIDLDRLKTRISDYFNADISHEEIARRYPGAMKSSSGFVVRDARAVRDALLARGGPDETGFVRHAYRPFDNRWLYWEAGHGLLGRPVPDYRPQAFEGNLWLSAAQHLRKDASEPQTCISEHLASLHLIERTALMFPIWLRDENIGSDGSDRDPRNPGSELPSHVARRTEGGDAPLRLEPWPPDHAAGRTGGDGDSPRRRPNLSAAARRYLERLGLSVEDLFHHVLAVLHDPAYREANAGALAMEWPRIPLPGWPTLGNGAPGNGASDDAGIRGRNARPALVVPASSAPSVPVLPVEAGSKREPRRPGNAGVSPALSSRPVHQYAGVSSASTRGGLTSPHAGETPAFPGESPTHEGHEPTEDFALPGNGAPDEPDPNPGESRPAPSRHLGRREAAEALARSAARGRELARLLDSDRPVPGVTTGTLRPELAAVAVPATTDGRNMAGDDFALTAGWGHYGAGGAVMPGQGRIVERAFTPDERAALGGTLPALGQTTFDVYLNARAFWRNVPAAIWRYKLGGYQVLKKWLSYREASILGRPLHPEEVQHFTDAARRIAAILGFSSSTPLSGASAGDVEVLGTLVSRPQRT